MSRPSSTIELRLFIGTAYTSALQMHLSKSPTWQRAEPSVVAGQPLLEVLHDRKKYLGLYAATDHLTLQQLKEIKQSLLATLAGHCPQWLEVEEAPLWVIGQLFIG